MFKTLRVAGLAWADAVMEGMFFIMQTYLTSVWKLSFTNAAAFLNIWGGIYRILPIFFLFIAETTLGNFIVLVFSAISSTTGIVLLTVATAPLFQNSIAEGRCQEKGDGASCVGYTEKLLFISGMVLIALGRAARSASTRPFMDDQTNFDVPENPCSILSFFFITPIIVITPVVVIFVFPYVKKWYVLFGVSAACTAIAALFFLGGVSTYKKVGPNPTGSPMTDILRGFVAAFLKISQPFPQDNTQLHRIDDNEEFQDFSTSRILGFLHKAAIILPGEDDVRTSSNPNKSWKLCSVSQVETVKAMIRMPLMWGPFIVCGIVSSAGNTYFVEQASHMNSNIGSWKAPLQLLLIAFALGKLMSCFVASIIALGRKGAIAGGGISITFSVMCCTVAAAVERRRLHVVRRHGLLDNPDDSKVPMSAFWLWFQGNLLSGVDAYSQFGLSAFMLSETAASMKGYEDCLGEAVSGLGFISSAAMVFVVGKISEKGSSKNWFQYTLNRSRLDRYYWVLSVVTSLNLIAFVVMVYNYRFKKRNKSAEEEFEENFEELGPEVYGFKKTSAIGLLWSQVKLWMELDEHDVTEENRASTENENENHNENVVNAN